MVRTDSRASRSSEGGGSKKLALAVAVLTLLTAGFGVLSAYLGVQTQTSGTWVKIAVEVGRVLRLF